ncbi:MAG: transglycosylase domain-containing protein [Streptosporangiaceae bacterium]
MGNPDFSGPSWQDTSESPDGSSAYRGTDGYGRADADRPSSGSRTPGSASGYGPAASNAGYQRRGYDAADSRDGNGSDTRHRRNGEDSRYGEQSRSSDVSRYSDAGHNGEAGHRRRSRAYRIDSDNGYQSGGRRSNGYSSNGGYGSTGDRSGGDYAGNRYGAEDRPSDGYGSNGDAKYSRSRRSRGRSNRHGGHSTSYRSGTGLVEGGPAALPDADGYGYGGPSGPYGPGGPRGPYRPGGRGGGGDDYGPGGGRGGPRGLADPDRRRTQQPGGFRQGRGSWWRHWTVRKAALVVSCMALVGVLILIAGFFYIYSTVQLPLQALSKPLIQSSNVYFSDGKTMVGCFCTTNRRSLTSTDLASNKYLEQAFFAAEDRHYLTEGGISLTGTARAILVDLTGKGYQGGSTITEQFVKTYFDPSGLGNLTYKEKIKEIVDAIKLAKIKDKQWILTHYLNAIYLGSGAYGVEAAAETYFGVHAKNVDAAQAAMLAAMVQAPSVLDPQHPAEEVPSLGYSLLDRWVSVLQNMAGDTFPDGSPVLTQAQFQQLVPDPSNHMSDLKNFPKPIKASSKTRNWSGFHGYIMNAVMNELQNTYRYTPKEISSLGLQITTTFDLNKMKALYREIAYAKHLMRLDGQAFPTWGRIGAILENPRTGAIEAMYGGPGYNAKHCKVLDCKFDMALQARAQVGSSFKPYVLAAAVKQNMNVMTSKLNGTSPLCVPPDTPQYQRTLSKLKHGSCPPLWATVTPDNATKNGPVRVNAATAASSNPAFVDLAHRVGTQYIIDLAHDFGVAVKGKYSSKLQSYLGETGIALGIASLKVVEQASTFATLANGGVYHTPHVIAKITKNGQQIPLKVKRQPVLTPKQTADVDWALSFDTNSSSGYTGTGTNAVLSPYRPTIGKTGTTDSSKSAWFLGALPSEYSFVVGMFTRNFNDDAQTLAILPSVGGWGGGYGGAWPAKIWQLYMTKLLSMSHTRIAPLAQPDVSGMDTWIQAKPIPKKPKCKPFWFGGGNGNGNGNGKHGQGQPCPSPTPSGPPTPNPTPSGFPSPSPSGFPSPSPSHSPPGQGGAPATAATRQSPAGRTPSHRQAASTPSLTTAATVPQSPSGKPVWAATTTGLV